jgi:hypothetical protein
MASDHTRELIEVAAHACDVLVNYIAWMRRSSRGAVLAEMCQSTPPDLELLWVEFEAFLAAS